MTTHLAFIVLKTTHFLHFANIEITRFADISRPHARVLPQHFVTFVMLCAAVDPAGLGSDFAIKSGSQKGLEIPGGL